MNTSYRKRDLDQHLGRKVMTMMRSEFPNISTSDIIILERMLLADDFIDSVKSYAHKLSPYIMPVLKPAVKMLAP